MLNSFPNGRKYLSMNKKIISIPQAARVCSLSRVTIWKYVKSGDLKSSQTPGGQFRILNSDLKAFMQRKRMHPFGSYKPEKEKILLVDDDLRIQKVLTAMLAHHGFLTEVAGDGFEAGIKVMSFKPDLIILDLFMPGMNGFEVCKRIKGDPGTSHIKILAITGYDSPENRDRIMTLGADGYLPKPVFLETLLQNVAVLLNKAGEIKPGKSEENNK
jgi:excisionase family DNA binding protein